MKKHATNLSLIYCIRHTANIHSHRLSLQSQVAKITVKEFVTAFCHLSLKYAYLEMISSVCAVIKVLGLDYVNDRYQYGMRRLPDPVQ